MADQPFDDSQQRIPPEEPSASDEMTPPPSEDWDGGADEIPEDSAGTADSRESGLWHSPGEPDSPE
ncbi:MAG: hypothetical protein JXN59_19240, partial [Anaerolineae bacterium]|nr:hypothetical protein [Anaerolineae bacterium]